MSKNAVDRLWNRLRDGEPTHPEDRAAYDEFRGTFVEPLIEVESLCRDRLSVAVGQTSRMKTLETVVGKLRRGTIKLSQIADIGGCRVLVPGVPVRARRSQCRGVHEAGVR